MINREETALQFEQSQVLTKRVRVRKANSFREVKEIGGERESLRQYAAQVNVKIDAELAKGFRMGSEQFFARSRKSNVNAEAYVSTPHK